jgi:hypothetical protein
VKEPLVELVGAVKTGVLGGPESPRLLPASADSVNKYITEKKSSVLIVIIEPTPFTGLIDHI